MQCSRVLRVLLMAAVVHSRRVKHLGSATIVLSLSLSVQHNLAPFQRGKLLVLAVILEKPCIYPIGYILAKLHLFFSFSFDILSSISSFLLLTHFCGFFLFVSRPSSLLLQRLSSNQLVDTASDVADIVRLSVRRVDPVFELDLERKLPFVDHVISGWPCSKGLVKAVVHTIGEHVPSKPSFFFEPGCCCHPVRKRLRLLDRHRLAHGPLVDGVCLCNVHAEELALGCVVTLQLLEVVKDPQERGSGVRTCSHHQRAVVPDARCHCRRRGW